jgi:flagella basal body P-ring formation protein FlgA
MIRLTLILTLWLGLMAGITPLSAHAASVADQVTANRALQRGAIIREGDLSGPYVTEDYVGRELVRSVRSGAVMSPHHVRTPLAVKRNETVTLIFKRGALTMETMGRSLDQGSLGDRVSVLNATSRKRITGRIIGQGLVEVTP